MNDIANANQQDERLDQGLDSIIRASSLKGMLASHEPSAFLAQAQRAIDQQRRLILDAEIRYHTKRAELSNALSDLDAHFTRQRQEMQGQLERLTCARDGSAPQGFPF